jgi:hypothetical protein
MSKEATVVVGFVGVLRRSWISSVVFFTLKERGGGAICFIFELNTLANLYAGTLRQFTTGRMGWSCLWSFLSLVMHLN